MTDSLLLNAIKWYQISLKAHKCYYWAWSQNQREDVNFYERNPEILSTAAPQCTIELDQPWDIAWSLAKVIIYFTLLWNKCQTTVEIIWIWSNVRFRCDSNFPCARRPQIRLYTYRRLRSFGLKKVWRTDRPRPAPSIALDFRCFGLPGPSKIFLSMAGKALPSSRNLSFLLLLCHSCTIALSLLCYISYMFSFSFLCFMNTACNKVLRSSVINFDSHYHMCFKILIFVCLWIGHLT